MNSNNFRINCNQKEMDLLHFLLLRFCSNHATMLNVKHPITANINGGGFKDPTEDRVSEMEKEKR